jgi:apolipoprotein N-acyltransferase
VHDTTDLFRKAIVTTTITTTSGQTPYVRFGDWIVLVSALGIAVATVVAVRRALSRRRSGALLG